MSNKYDVIIVGAGPAGIFSAYELMVKNKDAKVLLIDKGHSIYDRKCPIIDNKSNKCIKCRQCSIMTGFAGAGAFSDAKFNITTEYGGWINEYIPDDIAIDYMNKFKK